MRLVEQHVIARGDGRYRQIDAAAFASKNPWNAASYLVRQSFIKDGCYLNNMAVYHLIKGHPAYQALPRKVSNQVLLQLHKAWESFFEAVQVWRKHPKQFTGRPKLPKYKHKTAGRNLLVYERGAIWKWELDRGLVVVSGLGELVQTKQTRKTVDQVRIVPKGDHYVLEVVYQREASPTPVDPELFAAADLGYLGPYPDGVLILDETGDPKRGHRIELAARQYLGKVGHVANRVVAVTSHWTDGTRHVPIGVKPYRPASHLPKGKSGPSFHTKPDLAWTLIKEARAAGIPFRLVVADSVYGENARLEARLFAARIPYIMGLRPSHGTQQWVEDPKHPPAFTPAEVAQRLPKRAWQRPMRWDSHGKELVRYVAELELGNAYGPTCGIRLVAATSLSMSEASTEQVYELYRLGDWIEHYYKPAKHELGQADYQMRPERAIVRHQHLVTLAFTFSLLMGSPPAPQALTTPAASLTAAEAAGEKRGPRRRETDDLGRNLARGAPMALPLGSCAALLAALVKRCSVV